MMLDLVSLADEADRLAEQARRARCCDALHPCRRCMMLRRSVAARRLVIAFPMPSIRLLAGVPRHPCCEQLAG